MKSLWLANLINLVLDPCLIFGLGPFPELGVTGAAVATSIGRGTGVLYQLSVLARGRGRLRVRRGQLRLEPAVLLRLLRVSLTGMAQFLVGTASWIGLVRIVALFGSAVLAGFTIAMRITVLAILPSWGMSNAAATLVGQNLGARKPERAERSAWVTGFYNMLFLAALGGLFVALAEPLVGLFAREAAVVTAGAQCLRLISYGYPFYAYGMVLVQAFNGAGDTVTPTVVNFFCYWLFEIPLAWALAIQWGLGPTGVFMSVTIAESVLAVVAALVFRRGKWKAQKI
jgi:putative MATE family efflux protein